jgi:hypothetical protein
MCPACVLRRTVRCFVLQFQEEEREKNESNLVTLVSDSISAMVFFTMFVRDNDAREALFSTLGRLFEGLSDIAKAVMIILVADTLLGYHSEEGGDRLAVWAGAWWSRQSLSAALPSRMYMPPRLH